MPNASTKSSSAHNRVVADSVALWDQDSGDASYLKFKRKYWSDPVGFARDCIIWPEGHSLTSYQREILSALVSKKRVSVRGPHGLGKSGLSAISILWFALTRDLDDWKIPTTASAWRQLEKFLWPEVHKWARRINWSAVGREPFSDTTELFQVSLRLKTGEAFALASDDYNMIEGAHADHLLYIFDESKRLDVSTPIPTPSGWTTMGDIVVGDTVLDEMGKPTKVTYVSPVLHDRPCCKVTFEDGSQIIADPGHLWAMLPFRRRQTWGMRHENDPRYKRKYERVKDWRTYWDNAHVVQTLELKKGDAIPTCYPLDLPDIDLPIDPYVLGAWLGDGNSYHASITSMDQEILDRIASAGYEISPHKPMPNNKARVYGITKGGLYAALRDLDLIENKHIPPIYLRASAAQRLELLRGLMDTDGTLMSAGSAKKDSRVSYTSVSKQLADGVLELVKTFGWKVNSRKTKTKLNGVEKKPAYILRWSADVCPFYLSRKIERWVPREAQASASTIRTVVSIEPVESVPTRCISVDSSRNLYLAGENFIPTHNTVAPATWDAAEGAMINENSFWLAVSTPGEPSGRFYDIQSRKPGYNDWWVRRVTIQEAVDAGRVTMKWVDDRRTQWGETSAVFINRVMGDFASNEQDGVIPLSWVEDANERWVMWDENKPEVLPEPDQVGIDVARQGSDKTVFAERIGYTISNIEKYSKGDTMETAGRANKYIVGTHETISVVDVIGIGAGVFDRLYEQAPYRVFPFNAAESSEDATDISGTWKFVDKRSHSWWHMRELLDPANGFNVCLPLDDDLTGDLTAPTWKVTSNGRIRVEPKDMIRARIHRSTDCGDAVIQAFYPVSLGGMDFG